MRLKVAILEDDEELRDAVLVPQLAQRGFDVEGFDSAAALYRRMLAVPIELLVLDVVADDGDPFDVARYLRQHVPIGIVTLASAAQDRAQMEGASGAIDAWLCKPVDVALLAATLRSVARNLQAAPKRRARHAPMRWHLSEDGWHLHSPQGRSVPLNLQERSMLVRLFADAGKLVLHEDIITTIEAAVGYFDRHRLEMLIHRLRRKVAAELDVPLPLRSVRGAGYVMLAS